MSDTGLLSELRIRTREWHERLEADLDLLRPDFKRDDLAAVLLGFYSFVAPWEQQAIPLLNEKLPGFYSDRRLRTPRLLADLEVLGISQEAAATVNAAAIPQVQTLAQVLGSLYVLEGSTLGGQLLTRHFEKSLGLRGGAGCSFFASYGNDVGKMWTEFRTVLVNHADPSTHPEIIESAIETFRLVHAALCAEKGVAEVVTASH